MPKPAMPTVPPPPLRSNPDTFSARLEASLLFWEIFAAYLDAVGDFTGGEADRATAAALAAGAADGLDLTGQAGRFLAVNASETGQEFRKALALTEGSNNAEVNLTSLGRTLLSLANDAAGRTALGAQAALGFTPVQQGGANVINLSWDNVSDHLVLQVDADQLGVISNSSSPVDSLGAYVFAKCDFDVSFGAYVGGWQILPTSAATRVGVANDANIGFNTGPALTGTWMCCGVLDAVVESPTNLILYGATLFRKVSA